MQTREETNTDASLGNTPLAVPLATERNPSKRGCRGICSLAKCSGSQVSVLRYDVLMPDHSTTSSRCGAVFLRHSNIRCRCLGWVMGGRVRIGTNFLCCCSIGRLRSCVRPFLGGGEAAGHNALRGSGPNQKHAFKDALTQTGSPDPGSTLSALRRHVLANSFKLETPSSFPGLTSLNCSGFDANQSIALRCRRVGAVHSIKSSCVGTSARRTSTRSRVTSSRREDDWSTIPTMSTAGSSRGSCSRLRRKTGSVEKIATATMKAGLL